MLFKAYYAIVQLKRMEKLGCDSTCLFPVLLSAAYLAPVLFCVLPVRPVNQCNSLTWSRVNDHNMVGICWVNELNQVIERSSTRTGPRRR